MFNKIVYILISLGGDSASIRYVVTLHTHKHTTSGIYILMIWEKLDVKNLPISALVFCKQIKGYKYI